MNTKKMALMCALEDSKEKEAGDLFFSRCLRKYKANLPTLNDARRFSCELEYFHTIGSHASHIYLKAEEQARIYERHFIHLLALINASNED